MMLAVVPALAAVEYGVRITAVSASLARHKFLDKTTSVELLDRLTAGEAFGRAAEPWEVAATIAFLASDYSSYLTGEVIWLIRVNRGAAVWFWMALAVIGGCRPTVLGGVDSRAS